MTAVIHEEAVLQAVSLCWLARAQSVFPVAHGDRCGWCDYPVEELAELRRLAEVSQRNHDAYWDLPRTLRRAELDAARALE